MGFNPFAESFTRYKLASFADADLFADLASRWTLVSGGGLGTIIANGRNGQALRLGFGSAVAKTLPHSGRWVVGRAYRLAASPFGNDAIYQLSNNTNVLFTLRQNVDGTLSMHAGVGGDPVIGVSERALDKGIWYYIEVDITIGGGSPLTVSAELRINAHVEASGVHDAPYNASQNLSFPSTGGVDANYHQFSGTSGSGGSGGCDMDDLYIKNNSGYYGDVRIVLLVPNGDGGVSDWTPDSGSTHYDRVNSYPVDLTKYLETPTANDIDTWDWQDCPGFSGTIKAVNISMFARKDDEGTKSFKIVVGSSGTDGASDEYFVSDALGERYEWGQETDPATGIGWTQAGFNATQWGVKLIS